VYILNNIDFKTLKTIKTSKTYIRDISKTFMKRRIKNLANNMPLTPYARK